jgi:hypothetical protein
MKREGIAGPSFSFYSLSFGYEIQIIPALFDIHNSVPVVQEKYFG